MSHDISLCIHLYSMISRIFIFLAFFFFFFNDTATTEIYTLSLHDALPIFVLSRLDSRETATGASPWLEVRRKRERSEEHTSELQSRLHLVCRLLLEKKKKKKKKKTIQ